MTTLEMEPLGGDRRHGVDKALKRAAAVRPIVAARP